MTDELVVRWSPDDRESAVSDDEVAAVGNAAARPVLDWLDRRPGRRSLGVLGVSQGACIAFQLLRAAPRRFAYAVNLSGYCLPGTEAGDAVLARTRPPVFWGRGRFDDIVPPRHVERTEQWLSRHATLTARTYDAGHAEPAVELADVAAFVAAR